MHQKFQLFSAASEKERISAFKPDYLLALKGFLKKKRVYFLLPHGMIARTFSCIYQFGPFGYERHHSASDECVVNDYIGFRKDFFALQRDE